MASHYEPELVPDEEAGSAGRGRSGDRRRNLVLVAVSLVAAAAVLSYLGRTNSAERSSSPAGQAVPTTQSQPPTPSSAPPAPAPAAFPLLDDAGKIFLLASSSIISLDLGSGEQQRLELSSQVQSGFYPGSRQIATTGAVALVPRRGSADVVNLNSLTLVGSVPDVDWVVDVGHAVAVLEDVGGHVRYRLIDGDWEHPSPAAPIDEGLIAVASPGLEPTLISASGLVERSGLVDDGVQLIASNATAIAVAVAAEGEPRSVETTTASGELSRPFADQSDVDLPWWRQAILSPDGNHVVGWSTGGAEALPTLELVDIERNSSIRIFDTDYTVSRIGSRPGRDTLPVAWTPSGESIVAVASNALLIHDVESGEESAIALDGLDYGEIIEIVVL